MNIFVCYIRRPVSSRLHGLHVALKRQALYVAQGFVYTKGGAGQVQTRVGIIDSITTDFVWIFDHLIQFFGRDSEVSALFVQYNV